MPKLTRSSHSMSLCWNAGGAAAEGLVPLPDPAHPASTTPNAASAAATLFNRLR
jgi:hypothetical protein